MKKYIRTLDNNLLVFNENLNCYINGHTKEFVKNIKTDIEGNYLQQVVKNRDLVKFKGKVVESKELTKYEIENYATEIFFKCLTGFTLVAIRNKKGEWETI